MRKILSTLLLVSFFMVNYGYASKLFLIGGDLDGNYPQIYNDMASIIGFKLDRRVACGSWDTSKCPKVAIITSAADSSADGDKLSYSFYKKLFEDNGFVTAHVSAHIDNYKNATNLSTAAGKRNEKIINQANIIFFNGGNQAFHSRTWLNNDGSYNQLMQVIHKRFDQGVLVAGTSAGMAVQGQVTFGGANDSDSNSFGIIYFHTSQGLAKKHVIDGTINGTSFNDTRVNPNPSLVELQQKQNGGDMLGFSFTPNNVILDTHFGIRGRIGRLISAMIDTNKSIGIGIDQEDTALLLESDDSKNNKFTARAYGKNGVYIFSTANSKIASKDGFLKVSNITMDYLSAGDKVSFNKNKLGVISAKNKHKINPAFNLPIATENILAPYNVFNTISKLAKDKVNVAIGKTKTPPGYPASTPIFKFTFRKGKDWQAYCIIDNNKCKNGYGDYTIKDLSVSIEPQ
ncbi:cyanophycinase [Francisella sp. 19X1-34]|uniref:cyanophycinase n=1 Tax=Francisella sp. 19X1-34 TaxID=3087177 RepID=UPI002E372152|nr:cyanophycinase [Francisella sp. 19X1-34]MED7787779.1 cyanophycinase [Francisella sp. 19X1-34]